MTSVCLQLFANAVVLHVVRRRLLVVTALEVRVTKETEAIRHDALFPRYASLHSLDVSDKPRRVNDDAVVIASLHI